MGSDMGNEFSNGNLLSDVLLWTTCTSYFLEVFSRKNRIDYFPQAMFVKYCLRDFSVTGKKILLPVKQYTKIHISHHVVNI